MNSMKNRVKKAFLWKDLKVANLFQANKDTIVRITEDRGDVAGSKDIK